VAVIRSKNAISYVDGFEKKLEEMVDWIEPGGQLIIQTNWLFGFVTGQHTNVIEKHGPLALRLLQEGWGFEFHSGAATYAFDTWIFTRPKGAATPRSKEEVEKMWPWGLSKASAVQKAAPKPQSSTPTPNPAERAPKTATPAPVSKPLTPAPKSPEPKPSASPSIDEGRGAVSLATAERTSSGIGYRLADAAKTGAWTTFWLAAMTVPAVAAADVALTGGMGTLVSAAIGIGLGLGVGQSRNPTPAADWHQALLDEIERLNPAMKGSGELRSFAAAFSIELEKALELRRAVL